MKLISWPPSAICSATLALLLGIGASTKRNAEGSDRGTIDSAAIFVGAGLGIAATGFLLDQEIDWPEGSGPGKFYALGGAFAALGLVLHVADAHRSADRGASSPTRQAPSNAHGTLNPCRHGNWCLGQVRLSLELTTQPFAPVAIPSRQVRVGSVCEGPFTQGLVQDFSGGTEVDPPRVDFDEGLQSGA